MDVELGSPRAAGLELGPRGRAADGARDVQLQLLHRLPLDFVRADRSAAPGRQRCRPRARRLPSTSRTGVQRSAVATAVADVQQSLIQSGEDPLTARRASCRRPRSCRSCPCRPVAADRRAQRVGRGRSRCPRSTACPRRPHRTSGPGGVPERGADAARHRLDAGAGRYPVGLDEAARFGDRGGDLGEGGQLRCQFGAAKQSVTAKSAANGHASAVTRQVLEQALRWRRLGAAATGRPVDDDRAGPAAGRRDRGLRHAVRQDRGSPVSRSREHVRRHHEPSAPRPPSSSRWSSRCRSATQSRSSRSRTRSSRSSRTARCRLRRPRARRIATSRRRRPRPTRRPRPRAHRPGVAAGVLTRVPVGHVTRDGWPDQAAHGAASARRASSPRRHMRRHVARHISPRFRRLEPVRPAALKRGPRRRRCRSGSRAAAHGRRASFGSSVPVPGARTVRSPVLVWAPRLVDVVSPAGRRPAAVRVDRKRPG